tara:strand:+ start:1270 stop:1977 length:708 start_codon:yes stop_codon:yes gene_type:complete
MLTIKSSKLNLSSKCKVLDMGCGEGRHTISFNVFDEVDSFGFDLSLEDLKKAKEKLKDFNTDLISSKCHFGSTDIHNLPFLDNTFDAVICSEVLEHIESVPKAISELVRVLKPKGVLGISVPRFLPEWICWKLSRGYQEMPGGHIRIFKQSQLRNLVEEHKVNYLSFHWAHALHSPYWWLQCLFWETKEDSSLIKLYHKFLVWDLMKKPFITKLLEVIFQPLIGKSLVMYFKKDI